MGETQQGNNDEVPKSTQCIDFSNGRRERNGHSCFQRKPQNLNSIHISWINFEKEKFNLTDTQILPLHYVIAPHTHVYNATVPWPQLIIHNASETCGAVRYNSTILHSGTSCTFTLRPHYLRRKNARLVEYQSRSVRRPEDKLFLTLPEIEPRSFSP
jgi:hypothetical protein